MTLSDLSPQHQQQLRATVFYGPLSLLGAYWGLLCNRPFTPQETRDLLNEINADADPPDPSNYANIVRRTEP